jgi:putative endopeptidase
VADIRGASSLARGPSAEIIRGPNPACVHRAEVAQCHVFAANTSERIPNSRIKMKQNHITRLAPTFLVAVLSLWPVFVALSSPLIAARAQAADDRKLSSLERTVDASIKPGDDFFAYANGSWLAATAIPAGKERWGARDEIHELTRQRVAKLLDDASAAPLGSPARKVADFRAAYMNEVAIEAMGLAPLKPMLNAIERIQDRAALTRLLAGEMRADVDPLNFGVYSSSNLLGLSVERSIHGEKNYVAFLLQGGLGLPDREKYLSDEASTQKLRTRYQEYIGRILSLAGFDRADQRAVAVMGLETAIARSQATADASANDHNADNLWTRADFARNAPGMDWSAFFDAAGLGKQESFVVWQPSAVQGVAALVASQPVETWKDYLRFHILDQNADVLPRAFAEQALAVQRSASNGQPQQSTRAQRALEATQSAMSEPLGKMYAERYFTGEQKARVRAIVANVTAALVRRVEAATWMSPGTKATALAKLKALYVGVGYPEQWQDYSDLAVDPADPVGNLRRVSERNYRRALGRIGQPIDRTEWLMAPQTPGAVLVFEQNAYDFAAALLQPPKFDETASDAATYGAIGAIIGHDVTHFVDLLGAQYDVEGRARRWWTPEDSVRFQTLAEPLVNQFSGYRPFPDSSVNGKLTETENIADLGGLAAAFDAYRLSLGSRIKEKGYVRQHDREFFIAFAQSWRAKIGEGAMRKQLASDHAPENYRVATVRNFDAWYDAFDVVRGQRLYLEPKARVRIW